MKVVRDQAHRTDCRFRRRVVPSVLFLVATLCSVVANGQAIKPTPVPQDSLYQKSTQRGLARARSVAVRLRRADEPILHEDAPRGASAAYRVMFLSVWSQGGVQ